MRRKSVKCGPFAMRSGMDSAVPCKILIICLDQLLVCCSIVLVELYVHPNTALHVCAVPS
jgi:hypothetical protein